MVEQLNLQRCAEKEKDLIIETSTKISQWFPDKFYISTCNSKFDETWPWEIEWIKDNNTRLTLAFEEGKISYLKCWLNEQGKFKMEDHREVTDNLIKELFEWLWTN